jgi:hypothetical protein
VIQAPPAAQLPSSRPRPSLPAQPKLATSLPAARSPRHPDPLLRPLLHEGRPEALLLGLALLCSAYHFAARASAVPGPAELVTRALLALGRLFRAARAGQPLAPPRRRFSPLGPPVPPVAPTPDPALSPVLRDLFEEARELQARMDLEASRLEAAEALRLGVSVEAVRAFAAKVSEPPPPRFDLPAEAEKEAEAEERATVGGAAQ